MNGPLLQSNHVTVLIRAMPIEALKPFTLPKRMDVLCLSPL